MRKLSPELKRRSRSLLRLTRISLFLAVGLLCAFVGIVDFLSARLLEDRLLGVLLLSSGVLMIGSAVVLLKRFAWLLTLLAELSGTVVSVLFANAARRDFGSLQPQSGITFVGSGLAVIFLALAVDSALHRSEGKRQSQPSDRLNAILGLIGALVAALLALGGSWFTSRYLPSQQRPVLNIRATFGDQAEEKGTTTIPLTIRVKNAASHPVRILLAYYEVHGLPVTSAEDDQPSIEAMVEPFKEQIWPGPVQRYSRYTSNVPVTLVQYGRILPDAALLAPNEEATMEVLAAFPTGKFKAARVTTDFAAVRDDLMQIDEDAVTSELESFPCNKDFFADADPQPVQLVCHDYFTVWPVIADSLFERITSAPRLVRVGRVLRLDQLVTSEHGGIPPFPYLYVDFTYTDGMTRPTQAEKLTKQYQQFWTGSTSEISLRQSTKKS